MNDKQKRFAQEYLIDLNATQAAIRAGYSIAGGTPEILAKIRNHIELTVHYYLGNVAVGGEVVAEPGAGGVGSGAGGAEPGPAGSAR